MPLLATLTGVAMREGAGAAKEVLAKLLESQDDAVRYDT
jgi:hypothetical protein